MVVSQVLKYCGWNSVAFLGVGVPLQTLEPRIILDEKLLLIAGYLHKLSTDSFLRHARRYQLERRQCRSWQLMAIIRLPHCCYADHLCSGS